MVYLIISYPGLIQKIPELDGVQYYDITIIFNVIWFDAINMLRKLKIPEIPLYDPKEYEKWLNDQFERSLYEEKMNEFKNELIQLLKDEKFMRAVKSVIIYDFNENEVYTFKAREVIHANAIWSNETVNKLIETIDKLIKP